MNRSALPTPSRNVRGAACAAGLVALLTLGLFGPTLLAERNFVYRDAGHFYYPYLKLIAQEWAAGRVPLWNPYENGGTPLLANPTAAVLYPLKLVFLLAYPLAFKLYHVGHVALAGVAMLAAARTMRLSWTAAALAAVAYAGSGFVLFQVYNVVFLVGAAWLPLGMACADRLVRHASVRAAVALAVVMALQTLGGDPQTAFLTGVVATAYATLHCLDLRRGLPLLALLLAVGGTVVQARLVLPEMAYRLGAAAGDGVTRLSRAFGTLPPGYGWRAVGLLAFAVSAVGLVALVRPWRGAYREVRRRCWRLAGVAGLTFLLAAVQTLPTAELVGLSDRSAPHAPHEPAAFSVVPLRLLGLAAPTLFGTGMPLHTRWFPLAGIETGIWVPDYYLGLAPLLLGLAALRWRRGGRQRRFLTWLLLAALLASAGKFGGLKWLVAPDAEFDPIAAARDTRRYGSNDGLYRVLEETVPGFASFRYPAKLMVFSTYALALLAGFGLDGLRAESVAGNPKRRRGVSRVGFRDPPAAGTASGDPPDTVPDGRSPATERRRPTDEPWRPFARLLAGVSGFLVLAAAAAWLLSAPLAGLLARVAGGGGGFGPFVADAAVDGLVRSLLHTAVVAGVLAALLRRPRAWTPWAVASLTVAELLVCQRWMVFTDRQDEIDREPAVLAAIREHAGRTTDQPYRVHRTRIFQPLRWNDAADPERVVEMTRWERDTAQPKYGVPFGMQYVSTAGTMALYDPQFFLAPSVMSVPEPLRGAFARQMGRDVPTMVYFFRTGYDLWNTRYLILPALAIPTDEDRSTFTLSVDRAGRALPRLASSPPTEDDYVVLHNPDALPRAWLVHEADVRPAIAGMRRKPREGPMEDLLYRSSDGGVPIWRSPGKREYPLRSRVMLEPEDAIAAEFSPGGSPTDAEQPTVTRYEPQSVRLTGTAGRAGFVVLADVFYPGWSATVNGAPVGIVRADRAMRAVPVPAGPYVVEMAYRSRPFEIGLVLSVLGWLGVLGWSLWRLVGVRR